MSSLVEMNHWDFVVASNDDVIGIKKGPTTGSGKMELHRLSAESKYSKFTLQTATGLHLSTDVDFSFALTKDDDLVCIKMQKCGAEKTEVHILSKKSNYQQFILQTGTCLHETDAAHWAFCMDQNNDLLCIKRGPGTGSEKTEVHRLDAASKYQKFNLQTGSGLHLTHFPDKGFWKFCCTKEGDLACIGMGPSTGSNMTELHILSRDSNFSKFIVHKGTCLHYTDPETKPWAWNFAIGSNNDLVCIGRGPTTGSGKTEVHKVARGKGEYNSFNCHAATCLHLTATYIEKEGAPELEVPAGCEVPGYWRHKELKKGFDERVDVDDNFVNQLQVLLDATYKSKTTRDRKGAAMPSRLVVKMAHRIEDASMWIRFCQAKKALNRRDGYEQFAVEYGDRPVKTAQWSEENGFSLDPGVNEYFLMHGSSPQGVIGVSNDGFRTQLAGTNAGSMFTAGCYLAECCSKSDEYAQTDDTFYEGLCALILCRTACGQAFRVTKPNDEAIMAARNANACDSVLGDREAVVGTYREFVVFNANLVYPEFVILYEREYADIDKGGATYEDGNLTQAMRDAVERGTQGDESKILDIFKEWDSDSNGSISKEELRTAMKKVCTGRLTDEDIDKLLAEADKNGDGVIDYEEFLAFLGY